MAISEELELDITGALDAIESLNAPLTELGTNLTESLNTAIESVDVQPLVDQLAAIDATGLTTTIDAAVDAADGTVPIEADTAAVPEEISASIDAADGTVVIDADASAVPGEIDSAIDSADTTVVIEPEVGDISGEIESEIEAADTTVVIDVDSSGLGEVESELGGLSSGLDTATGASEGLNSSVAALAGGDVLGGLTASLGTAGPAGAAAAVGLGAATAGVFALVDAGTEALASQQRFADTFGVLADQASRVQLGGLNADLGELAIKLGSDDEGLQDAASSLFQFGQAAGFTSEQSLELVNNASALAARAVALNPALGQVGDVAANISNAFARGGKFASKYGLSLTAAEIQARALSNTGKTTAAELSIQDKAFAGSQIAAERYGDGLEKTINKGAKNASIQQRSLNEQLSNFIEEAGKPLVAPFQQILKELLPVVKELLPVFTELALAVLPVIAQVIKDNIPLIKLFGQLFKELSPIITPLIRVSLLMLNPLLGISNAFKEITSSGAGLGEFFSGLNDAIGSLLVTVVDFGADLIDSFLVGIKEAFPAVIDFFANLGSTIFNTIGDVTTTVVQKGTDLITGLFNGITTAAVEVFNFFRNLAGTVFNTVGDVVRTLFQKGLDLIQGLIGGIAERGQRLLSFVREIPGNILRAFGSVLSLFHDVGKSIITGLKNGLTELLPNLLTFIKNKVVGAIKKIPFIGGLIGSPSPFFKDVGEAINQGLAQGIATNAALPVKAMDKVVAAIAAVPALPAVTAALPVSAGTAAAGTAGFQANAQTAAQGAGAGVHIGQLVVQTPAPNQVQVGIEVARQLRAEQFRVGK